MKVMKAREACRDFNREELLDTIDDLAAERDEFSAEMVIGDRKIATLEAENARLREMPQTDEALIERCAIAVHQAYCDNYLVRKGEPYWTGGDYSRLDEETKEIDRSTVRAVLAVLDDARKEG